MPEWLEYVSFARFLVVSSLFVGPIERCWERRWPDRSRTRANRPPELQSSLRPAREEAGAAAEASAPELSDLIDELLSEWFPLLIDWSARGKFLVGHIRSTREAASPSGRGSVAWLTLHPGTMGYPQFLVRWSSLLLSDHMNLSALADPCSLQPTAEARALIDQANQHQAQKFKERQEAAATAATGKELPPVDAGEEEEASRLHSSGGNRKKRKRAPAYKKTQLRSEVQFALLGESYSIVFYDRLCFSGACFHGSAEDLRCKLEDAFPHPLFCDGASLRLQRYLAESEDCIAIALQRAGCGFGTYSASELVAASGLSGSLRAEQVLANPGQRRKLLEALTISGRQQLAQVAKLGLFYNPADVLWGPIGEFRQSLLVYRKAGAVQYQHASSSKKLKVWTGRWLRGSAAVGLARVKPAAPIGVTDGILGVGPFEWRWQGIQRRKCKAGTGLGAPVIADIVQPDLRRCFDALSTGGDGSRRRALEACEEWLRCSNDDAPDWACELAARGDPKLREHEARAIARHLVQSCRGTLPSGAPAPYRIEVSPLFVQRPVAERDTRCGSSGAIWTYPAYIPRLAREVDYVLALRWEGDDVRRTTELADAAAAALQALEGSPPRSGWAKANA